MNQDQQAQLDRDGFLVLPGVLPAAQVQQALARLESLWLEEGDQAGSENYQETGARRLADLANKGEIFREMLAHPAVLEAVETVLGSNPRLSMLNARDPMPRFAANPQPLHTDADHGGRADEKGYLACTAIWMLDPFTVENGATRLVPGSHRDTALPKEAMADVLAAHQSEVIVEGRPGDVLVFNGHCWHAGRANDTGASRRAVLAHYVRGDQPLRLNQRAAPSPQVQAALPAGTPPAGPGPRMTDFEQLYARHETKLEDFWSRRANEPRFTRGLRLFGRPAILLSNDAAVLAAADYTEPLFSTAPPDDAPPLVVRLLVGPSPAPLAPLPENPFAHIHYMGVGQWLAIQFGAWGHCQVDLARGQALAVLTPVLAAQPELVSRCLLNTIFTNLLTAAGLAMLHATSLARGDRALLLMAPHGSGKSTAALRLALAGLPLMSDSQVYLSERGGALELTGFPVGRVKLRRDMLAGFPALQPLLTPEEVRGETKFSLNLRQLNPAFVQAEAIRPAVIDVCLLTRHAEPETILTPASSAEFIDAAMQNSLHYDGPDAWRGNVALIHQLAAAARCHHLVVGTDSDSLVAIARGLWETRPDPKGL